PLAPARFSTTKGWLNLAPRRSPMMRGIASAEPPGGNGTTMRTGLWGQSCGKRDVERNKEKQKKKTASSGHYNQREMGKMRQRDWPVEGATRVPYWVYQDAEVYAEEQRRIWRGATWSYLCLEAELPEPKSFVT